MSKNYTLEVNEFNNAFTVSVSFGVVSEEGYLKSYGYHRNYRVTRNGELVTPEKHGDVFLFNVNLEDVEIKHIEVLDVVETYTADTPGWIDIDKETYDKLTPNFQSKYKEVPSGKKVIEHDVEITSKRHKVDFDLVAYMGESVSELQKILKGEDYTPYPSVKNLSSTFLTEMQILAVLVYLYNQEKSSLKQLKLNAKEYFDFRRARDADTVYERIAVSYFVTPYNGETKKQLSMKQNGRPYADRRGRMVADYPAVASTVIIFAEDLSGIPLTGTDDEKLETIKSLYNSIFHP